MNLPEKFIVRNICSGGMSYVFVEDAHHCIVSSIDEILLGSRRYTREAVESFIERGLWEIVKENTKMCLPEKFKFVVDGWDYEAEQHVGRVIVSWYEDGCTAKQSTDYSYSRVEEYVSDGTWKIVDERPAPWEIGEHKIIETTSLLEKLKQLTINTTTNIFIVNGQYEVYYGETYHPAKADTDEELEKIVDAILTLNKAVNGDE